MAKIIIIEDEPLVAKIYKKALERENHEVHVAIGGKDGVEMIVEEKPDLVLLDIMMPEPNGIIVLDKIKSNSKTAEIPVVMLTNLSDVHDVELATQKGADDFWVKIDARPEEFSKKVEEILEKKKKVKEKSSKERATQ